MKVLEQHNAKLAKAYKNYLDAREKFETLLEEEE